MVVPTVLKGDAKQGRLSKEVSVLLGKGAVTLLPSEEIRQRYYSTYFLIPKRE